MLPRRMAGLDRGAATTTLMLGLMAALCWLMLVSASLAQGQPGPKFPSLTGRIVDDAGIINAADRSRIGDELKTLEAKSSDQIVVHTTKSLQGYPIEDFGYQLGRAWKIGQQGTNNGIVLIVAPNEQKVRIEVGRGLEPLMTDLMSKTIIENTILPAFRRGDFSGGIAAGVKDIKDVLLGDAEEVKRRAASLKKRSTNTNDWVGLLFMLMFFSMFAFIMYMNAKQAQQMQRNPWGAGHGGPPGRNAANPNDPRRNRWQQRDEPTIIVIPGSWGGSSSWPSGGGDSGWSGGGGGDFGGGGASGDW